MIKKLALALLLSGTCYADQVMINGFKYLNSNENSTIIDTNEAQDLLNVDITPGGKSFKKRDGYGLYRLLSSQSTGLHGGFHGYDTSGNDIQIWASSTAVFGIVADATPAQLISSMTINSTIDCTNTQGSMYCVSSSRDFYIRTNGATLTSWHTTPLGTMIESTPDRVAVSGVSATPSTIFVSASNNFTSYAVAPLATDPFTEVIGAPGSRITHLRWGCQKLLWWKDESFGYLDFEDQYSAQVKIISDNIGTFDNTSAVDPGGSVWFRGQDGHIYQYNCSGLTKETVEITPQMQASGRRSANSWTISSGAEFATGNMVSTITYNGSGVTISTSNTNLTNNSFESASGGWTKISPSGWTLFSLSGRTGDNCGFISPKDGTKLAFAATSIPFTLDVRIIDAVSGSVYGTTSITWVTNSCSWVQRTITATCPAKTSVKIDMSHSGGQAQSDAFAWSGTPITFWTASDTESAGFTKFMVIDFFENGKTTLTDGVYYSDVHQANNLSSWGSFQVNITSAGTQAFFVRASTNPFTILSSTPAWVAQTAGSIVASSTGTYMQMKDSFTVTYATQAPSLQNFTFNWFEGTAGDQAYMMYFDNAIWASMTYGVGISSNNYIFRRDLINQGWGLYNFGAGGMLIQSNRLYFGSVTNGNIFQFGTGTSDNGNAITAFWKSKDYTGNDPFMQSSLNQIDVFAKQNTGQSITSTYTTDTSTSTAYSVNLSNVLQSYIQSRKILPSGKTGYTFNLKLGDSSTTSDWEVFGFRITYITLPWKPTQ